MVRLGYVAPRTDRQGASRHGNELQAIRRVFQPIRRGRQSGRPPEQSGVHEWRLARRPPSPPLRGGRPVNLGKVLPTSIPVLDPSGPGNADDCGHPFARAAGCGGERRSREWEGASGESALPCRYVLREVLAERVWVLVAVVGDQRPVQGIGAVHESLQ